MLRPGGFPEYTPDQQKIFDSILETIQSTFRQHNYDHIYTPAVESVNILKKGGDIVDQQVYGLYGLAQGPEDTKDYALHFDLTIPFARFILDHRNNLTFPFRRYQMQPVWRGERTKRGRYKEFRQFDVDAVRPSETNVGVRYDIETLSIIDKAMTAVCQTNDIYINKILKISHLALTKNFLKSNGLNDDTLSQVLKLLDNYYKLEKQEFNSKLLELTNSELSSQIISIIETRDPSSLSILEEYSDLRTILQGLKDLDINYEYDICIVRGQNYYKGVVCEWMDLDDISLGSLGGGGRYDKITDFIDPKQSFSGVGASLGRFVPLAMEKILTKQTTKYEDKYIFINFGKETRNDIVRLYQLYIGSGKTCEIYPTPVKLGKQFEYADKKNIHYAVILGTGEKEQNKYKIKNLETGDETIIDL